RQRSMTGRFDPIDFDEFHLVDLPRRLAEGNGKLAVADLTSVKPIAFRLTDGRAYTYTAAADGIDITTGADEAYTIVELAYEDWCDFAWELRSCFALLYADRLTIASGSFGHLARWEPALRAAYDGQPVYDFANPPAVVDANGDALDLRRTFTMDDDDAAIRDFLERAGFV